MTITTHDDLRAAVKKTSALWIEIEEHKFACMREWSEKTVGRTRSCWHKLCRSLDRVVYAAGGHREHLTWHLYGASFTAEDLWVSEDHLPAFLLGRFSRTAHQELALKAFWSNREPPVSKPRPPRGLPLPALEGCRTEAEVADDEAARQLAIARFAAFRAERERTKIKAATVAKGGV